jgi:hypothetical protein
MGTVNFKSNDFYDTVTLVIKSNNKMGFSKDPNAHNCCEFFDNARQKRRVYRVINTSFLTQQYQKRYSKNMH